MMKAMMTKTKVILLLGLLLLLSYYYLVAAAIMMTPRNRVLLEKLIVSQLVKKFLAFYGSRKFITVFARARHWAVS
jgi:hypothetical protein